jgi:4-hydroxy-4-methyl-2-oxoglutarate aldolase
MPDTNNTMETEELVDGFSRLLEHGTNAIAAAIEIFHGVDMAMSEALRPLFPEFTKFCGPARTMAFAYRVATDVHSTAAGGGFDLYNQHTESLNPGDVFVLETYPEGTSANYGGNRNVMVRNRGVVGIIVDGYTRDVAELKNSPLPVFSKGPTARLAKMKPKAIDVEIKCGGVTVRPGDIICADISGIVVVPREKAEAILKEARMITENDLLVLRRVQSGMSPTEALKVRSPEAITKLDPRFATWATNKDK